MKKLIALSLAVTLAAPAFAGSPAPARVEPDVVKAEASSSSDGTWAMGLWFLLAVAIAAD